MAPLPAPRAARPTQPGAAGHGGMPALLTCPMKNAATLRSACHWPLPRPTAVAEVSGPYRNGAGSKIVTSVRGKVTYSTVLTQAQSGQPVGNCDADAPLLLPSCPSCSAHSRSLPRQADAPDIVDHHQHADELETSGAAAERRYTQHVARRAQPPSSPATRSARQRRSPR